MSAAPHGSGRQPVQAAEGRVRGRLRLRRVIHGHRPGRSHPARDLEPAARVAERDHAAVHVSYLVVTAVAMLITNWVS